MSLSLDPNFFFFFGGQAVYGINLTGKSRVDTTRVVGDKELSTC